MSPQKDGEEIREQARKNKRIDKQIKTEREKFNRVHRLLLLGKYGCCTGIAFVLKATG